MKFTSQDVCNAVSMMYTKRSRVIVKQTICVIWAYISYIFQKVSIWACIINNRYVIIRNLNIKLNLQIQRYSYTKPKC